MQGFIESYIKSTVDVKSDILNDDWFIKNVYKISEVIIKSYKNGGKVLLAGNGGSAADCQHFAGELVAKFSSLRKALPAIALTVDMPIITALSNDIGYKFIFSRQIEALGQKGDILIVISTSGSSENVVEAVNMAKEKGLISIALVGGKTCKLDTLCDYVVKIPSDSTPHIQESHIMIEHILCALIEAEFV